jgi:Zn-dependent protease
MEATLNPDYKVIYKKDTTGEIYLRNDYTNTLLSMSEGEYEVLEYYAKKQNFGQTISHFEESYGIDSEFLNMLIDRSLETDVLLNEKYISKKTEQKQTQLHSPIISYILNILNTVLHRIHLRTTFVLKGNIRFFKVFTIDLKNTFIEKIATSTVGQNIMIALYWILFAICVYVLVYQSDLSITSDVLTNLKPTSQLSMVLIIISGLLLSTLLHEIGHYVIYRKYGGQTSEMGLALVFGILPFVYVSTNSLYLWESKSKRIFVILAGILVDILLTICCISAFVILKSSPVAFLIAFFGYFIFIRIIFNLIPFIPATDGYFLLTELVNQPSLFRDAGFSFQKTWQSIKKRNFKTISYQDIIHSLYILLSYVFITAYYGILSLTLFLPYFIK